MEEERVFYFLKMKNRASERVLEVRAATPAIQELPPELIDAGTRTPSQRKGARLWHKASLGAQGHWYQILETLNFSI